MDRVMIVGGGLAGSLAALALARQRRGVELLLVEQSDRFGGNHIWSWFDGDIAPGSRRVLDGIDVRHWPDHDIIFPQRRRTLAMGYNSIRSADLDAAVRSALAPDQYRLGAAVAEVGETHVTLAGGERLEAAAILDARGPGPMPGQQLGWQKFVGRVYRFERPHRVARPVIMDATVAQHDGYRFLYLLPLSGAELLIEDTYYSANRKLDEAVLRGRLDEAAESLDAGAAVAVEEESGVLPVLIEGDFDAWWPPADRVARLGARGGFFHPTTSYSLPDAVANAALLARHPDLRTAALADLFRGRARRQWRDRRFFELLNRMLFRAAEPNESYRVLEHFYRLPTGLIGRFYAARLTAIDKLRILSGRPPVPLRRALSALRRTSA